jgi:predicted Zn-dependent peptidase
VTDSFERADLGGGLVALTERIPGIRSVTIGVWVRSGSVNETPAEMGISHLLEHMVFKGTGQRSAREIALVLERVGGGLDAYTTREHTAYQARVLDEFGDLALDVLADLVLEPRLRAEDLELERGVVLEEISTVDDTPEDLIFELQARQLWGDHPYGYSVLGTRETVGGLTVPALKRRHAEAYVRSNMVVAAVGHVDHGRFTERLAGLFEEVSNGQRHDEAGTAGQVPLERTHVERGTAQTHIVLGTRTFGHADPRRYAMILLSNAFGGGMSSRLFQRVREELGLAYSIYSYQSFYGSGGAAGIYVGTRPDQADHAQSVIEAEMRRLAAEGLTMDELSDVKGQVKGQLVLSLESSSARLHRLAGTALYDEPFRTVERVIAEVDAVTLDDVADLAAEYFDPDRYSAVRLGPAIN